MTGPTRAPHWPLNEALVVIPSYNGAPRVRHLLNSIARNDPEACDVGLLVVEDKCEIPTVAGQYDELLKDFQAIFPALGIRHLVEWSNMHGAAQAAFTIAIKEYCPDWIVYLGDDCIVTKRALSNMLYFIENNALDHVGLIQFPYWNAHDLCRREEGDNYGDWRGPALLEQKRDFFLGMEWTDAVPRNAYWDGEAPHRARPYVNVNGVGFACNVRMFNQVGGFAEGTWCLDESISFRCWRDSRFGIIALPGPPLVHYFGGSTEVCPPAHELHTMEAWEAAIGLSKEECGKIAYARMAERENVLKREAAEANYLPDEDPCS